MPSFWAVCARCEDLVTRHADAALLTLMAHEDQDEESRKASLAAFRGPDLAAEQFSSG